MTDKPIVVVQYTDTHLFSSSDGNLLGVDTYKSFEQVLRLSQLHHAAPDFYLLTGDLSQDETPESYRRFASLVRALPSPAYFVPGNHDVEAPMQSIFAEQHPSLCSATQFTSGRWQIVLLNTHEAGKVHGYLAKDELDRLDQTLAGTHAEHALIVMHHPPIKAGSAWMDNIGLINNDEFHAVIAKHPCVRGVVFGHIHQEFEAVAGGVRYFGSPSTCVQFKRDSPHFAVDAVPPGYRWLELFADGSIQSGVLRTAELPAGLDAQSLGY